MSNTDIIIHDDKDNVGVVVIDSTKKKSGIQLLDHGK